MITTSRSDPSRPPLNSHLLAGSSLPGGEPDLLDRSARPFVAYRCEHSPSAGELRKPSPRRAWLGIAASAVGVWIFLSLVLWPLFDHLPAAMTASAIWLALAALFGPLIGKTIGGGSE